MSKSEVRQHVGFERSRQVDSWESVEAGGCLRQRESHGTTGPASRLAEASWEKQAFAVPRKPCAEHRIHATHAGALVPTKSPWLSGGTFWGVFSPLGTAGLQSGDRSWL